MDSVSWVFPIVSMIFKSDKARRDAIAFGNDLTFHAAYNMAKTEESTTAQMDVIRGKQNYYKDEGQ